MSTTEPTTRRMPPGIFDDYTFGLRERFDDELIGVNEGARWWAEVTGLSPGTARSHAVWIFHDARVRKGTRSYYRRAVVESTLRELHGMRLQAWLVAELERSDANAAGLAPAGRGYPHDDLGLRSYGELATACVRRALWLGTGNAMLLLEILRAELPHAAEEIGHEWGWTAGLPAETASGLVPVDEAVRWWSITGGLGPAAARTEIDKVLETTDGADGPGYRRDELLRRLSGDRLNTLHRRITDSMDHLINEECSYADVLSAPDRIQDALREARRLDTDQYADLLRWVDKYFPHLAQEVAEEAR